MAGIWFLAQLCGGITAAGSLLESPRDNKKRDKKSESRSMPPLDYYYTVALTVRLSPPQQPYVTLHRLLRGVARRGGGGGLSAIGWKPGGHFMPLGLNVFRKSFFASMSLCTIKDSPIFPNFMPIQI